ncbi:MAG: glycosyltransferase family 2 protein [Terriglobales bacterium]
MSHARERRSPALVVSTLAVWVAVTLWSLAHFRSVIPATVPVPVAAVLAFLYLPWSATWLWTIHNFVNQGISALLAKPTERPLQRSSSAVAVLYTTCDDFDSDACLSALRQDHPNLRVIVCDDSHLQSSRDAIDTWVKTEAPEVTVVRRADRRGFKAGNLNHAMTTATSEEFVVLCDADEVLPRDFVTRVLSELESQSLAFVQCRHTARLPAQTWLEQALGPAIDVFYRFTLPLRNRFGFAACFGHGMMLRRSAWEAVGGFPEIACEDLGFAMRAAAAGLPGQYVSEPAAFERFPSTYAGLASKYRRIVAGTVECFRSCGPVFLGSHHVSLVEKLDFLMTFSTCYLPLAVAINTSGALALAWMQARFAQAQPLGWLLAFYLIGPLTPVVPLLCQFPADARRTGRFALVGSIAYASLVPRLAFASLLQTVRPKPVRFVPTGAVSQVPQKLRDHMWTWLAGITVIALAAMLKSSVLVPTITAGLMFLVGPLLSLVDRTGIPGWAARHSALVPYCALAILWWKFP